MLWALLSLFVIVISFFLVRSVFSKAPTNLGVNNGQLAACPASPNCVNTQTDSSDTEHSIEPITFEGDPEVAWTTLQEVLKSEPRTQIKTVNDQYFYVTFTSLIFRFVDDVEFYLEPEEKSIQFRSASREGYSDLGVNRKRMESIRQKFQAAMNKE
ncbi:Hypothetical protein PBC10988_22090 [Planctomycetales bacterium 10988]|nr:Hypothetical protein PBC10988_22090 [Planctomycetales bacterium 10988]